MDGLTTVQNLTMVNMIDYKYSSVKPFYTEGMSKETINSRIKRLRLQLGYTQDQLGKAIGISGVSVSKWESEDSEPKSKHLPAIAKALKVSLDQLLHGGERTLEPGPDLRGQVPLISWIQAGNWLEMDISQIEHSTYYAHTANVGPRAFALRVIGDSMTSTTGGKSIPDGSVVIVDPDITPVHGKVVVARLDDSNEATLKQLVIDGGQKYLKPFNNAYPMMPINGNCTIIGVVKQVVQEF